MYVQHTGLCNNDIKRYLVRIVIKLGTAVGPRVVLRQAYSSRALLLDHI
jgi:hypothetical protein